LIKSFERLQSVSPMVCKLSPMHYVVIWNLGKTPNGGPKFHNVMGVTIRWQWHDDMMTNDHINMLCDDENITYFALTNGNWLIDDKLSTSCIFRHMTVHIILATYKL